MNEKCLDEIKELCPNLDEGCLSQMDYYLIGRENFMTGNSKPAEVDYSSAEYYDNEYLRVGKTLLKDGQWQYNKRTGKKCLTYIGDMMKFDLSNGVSFPLLTTKKVFFRPMASELLGFIRGYDNAAQFRALGCNIWDANANSTKAWLNNPNRRGVDDLGRIYGVQARGWRSPAGEIDQLRQVVDKLNKRIDDRRLIVSHWNPAELDEMALPPCHLLYQFSLIEDTLHLVLYQRSADLPLGVPFNIASYALLLRVIAQITELKVGTFTHFMNNIHIYEDQLALFVEQMARKPYKSPSLFISADIKDLADLEDWVIADNFFIADYEHHPVIRFPFAE